MRIYHSKRRNIPGDLSFRHHRENIELSMVLVFHC